MFSQKPLLMPLMSPSEGSTTTGKSFVPAACAQMDFCFLVSIHSSTTASTLRTLERQMASVPRSQNQNISLL